MSPYVQIFGNGELWEQVEFLRDHRDSGGFRIARGDERHLPSFDLQSPLVRRVKPVYDFHQRALAGAVFSDERMDLAGKKVEIDSVYGRHAAKPFRQAHYSNDRVARRVAGAYIASSGGSGRVGPVLNTQMLPPMRFDDRMIADPSTACA